MFCPFAGHWSGRRGEVMGRGRWSRLAAVIIAIVMVSCGGTGGGPSDSGNQFVFTARGRLNVSIQPTNDPRRALITATLLDPQGLPFRNVKVTFFAEFQDAIFIPRADPNSLESNRGAAYTNDNGQATISLLAGLTLGKMRVLVEAPPALNIATGMTVELTTQGFVARGVLGIIPAEVTFVNPFIGELSVGMMTFHATGGLPPYHWDNSNKDIAKITPTGIENINETADYTLTGPIPTDASGALQDTVTLMDTRGTSEDLSGIATANVTVIFADCQLNADGTEINMLGVGGAQFQIDVSDGLPPFTATETFPGSIGPVTTVCDSSGRNCHLVITLPTPAIAVDPDTILIRDARGCTAQVQLTVEICGNGVLDTGEQCDAGVLPPVIAPSLATCDLATGDPASVGTVLCDEECKVDTSQCAVTDLCGNGVIDAGTSEQCDALDLGGATCVSLGFTTGGLLCSSSCTFDTSGCTNTVDNCGNGVIDTGEQCDTLNLGGASCGSLGFSGGGLVCDASECTFDTSGCIP